jgi:purine-cytosine permease-like protein
VEAALGRWAEGAWGAARCGGVARRGRPADDAARYGSCYGSIGIIVAAGNVWAFFTEWLSLLGILVPPIGAIILVDQYAIRSQAEIAADWRPSAFWASGCGSVVALFVQKSVPERSTAISAAVVAGVVYWVLSAMTRSRTEWA